MIVLNKKCPEPLWEKWTQLKMVQDQCSRTNLSGNQLWALATDKYELEGQEIIPKDVLRTHLIKEQNNICCYCGALLKDDHTTKMEHLNPKEIYPDKVFEYANLFASCSGGASPKIPYIVSEEDETIETIAKKFDCTVTFLIKLNNRWVENVDGTRQEPASAFYNWNYSKHLPFAVLKKGTKIYYQDKTSFHCDNKKGSDQINIQPIPSDGLLYSTKLRADNNPFVYGCANRIAYEETDGSILVDEMFEYSINDVLGLNIDKLKRERKKAFYRAEGRYQTIEDDCDNDKQLLVKKLEQTIKRLEQANGVAFKFVDIYYLQQKLILLEAQKS